MADVSLNPVDLAGVEKLVADADAVVREALEVASKRTDGGKGIDDEQHRVSTAGGIAFTSVLSASEA